MPSGTPYKMAMSYHCIGKKYISAEFELSPLRIKSAVIETTCLASVQNCGHFAAFNVFVTDNSITFYTGNLLISKTKPICVLYIIIYHFYQVCNTVKK